MTIFGFIDFESLHSHIVMLLVPAFKAGRDSMNRFAASFINLHRNSCIHFPKYSKHYFVDQWSTNTFYNTLCHSIVNSVLLQHLFVPQSSTWRSYLASDWGKGKISRQFNPIFGLKHWITYKKCDTYRKHVGKWFNVKFSHNITSSTLYVTFGYNITILALSYTYMVILVLWWLFPCWPPIQTFVIAPLWFNTHRHSSL